MSGLSARGVRGRGIILGNCISVIAAIGTGTLAPVLLQSQCVLFPPPPPVEQLSMSAGADVSIQQGAATTLSATAENGTGTVSYVWAISSGSTVTLSATTGQSVTASGVAIGATTVTVTATDESGATATDTVVVTVTAPPPPVVSAGSDTFVEVASVVALSGSATGGLPPYSYAWTAVSGEAQPFIPQNGLSQTISVTGTTPGTVVFQVTVTDSLGQTGSDTVSLTVYDTTFTLDADDLSGTSGDDTFSAGLVFSSGAQRSALQTGDEADGLGGSDVLNATVNETPIAPILNSIETINMTVFGGAAVTLDATDITGLTRIAIQNSTAANDLVVTHLETPVDMAITNSAADLTVSYDTAAVSGATDSSTLTLNGATGAVNIQVQTGTNTLETLNIQTSGAASTLTDLNATASLATINVSGNQPLIIGDSDGNDVPENALPNSVTVLNAASATAGVSVLAPPTDFTFTGGSAADTVIFASGGFTEDDHVTGGGGMDELGLASVDAVGLTEAVGNVTGIEALRITTALAGDIEVANFGAIQTVTLAMGVSGDQTLTMVPGTTVVLAADSATGDDDLTVTSSTDDSGDDGDTVTVELADESDAGGTLTGDLLLTGFEAVTLHTAGGVAQAIGGTVTIDSDVAGAGPETTLIITGDENLTITGMTVADVVNAASFAGDLTILMGDQATVTSGSGDDTITGSGAEDVINANAGNDTILGGAEDDTINAGAGDDEITGGVGDDIITTGAGRDDVNYTSGAHGLDTITDFATGATADAFDTDFATTTGFGAATNANVTPAAAGVTLLTATDAVFEVIGALRDPIADFEDDADVLDAISDTNVSVSADGDSALLILYSGGRAYLYEVTEGGDVNAVLGDGDLTLVAIFQNITPGSFVEANIK